MSGDKRAVLKQWLESGEVRLQPLTFPQRELWEASPVPVADMANHICCLIEVRRQITPEDGKRRRCNACMNARKRCGFRFCLARTARCR